MAYGAAGTVITGSPPAVRCFNSAAIACANNTDITVTFDSNRFDPTGMHSTSVNTNRITIASPGVYLLTFTGEFATNIDYTGYRAYIRLNGTTPVAVSNAGGTFTGAGAMGAQVNVTTLYKAAANDYFEVLVKQINGAAASRNLTNAANWSPEFAAVWVGLGT